MASVFSVGGNECLDISIEKSVVISMKVFLLGTIWLKESEAIQSSPDYASISDLQTIFEHENAAN